VKLRLLLPIAASLAILTAGCDELDLLLEPGSGSGGGSAPLSSSSDPAIQAAGASSGAVNKVQKADALLQKGLKERDPGALRDAVELRPQDPSLRYHQGAMLLAIGNISEAQRAFDEGAYLSKAMEPPGEEDTLTREEKQRGRTETSLGWLDALASTKAQFPADSPEWQRLNKEYCVTLKLTKEFEYLTVSLQLYDNSTCK